MHSGVVNAIELLDLRCECNAAALCTQYRTVATRTRYQLSAAINAGGEKPDFFNCRIVVSAIMFGN